jgi:hypothetical protein
MTHIAKIVLGYSHYHFDVVKFQEEGRAYAKAIVTEKAGDNSYRGLLIKVSSLYFILFVMKTHSKFKVWNYNG